MGIEIEGHRSRKLYRNPSTNFFQFAGNAYIVRRVDFHVCLAISFLSVPKRQTVHLEHIIISQDTVNIAHRQRLTGGNLTAQVAFAFSAKDYKLSFL